MREGEGKVEGKVKTKEVESLLVMVLTQIIIQTGGATISLPTTHHTSATTSNIYRTGVKAQLEEHRGTQRVRGGGSSRRMWF